MFIAGAIVGGVGVALMMGHRAQSPPPVAATATASAAAAPLPRGDVVPPGTDVQVTTPVAPASGTAAATSGRLVVTSTPAGAAVLIDGQSRGRTPLTIRGLSFATHTVVVARSGYKNETRRVRLSPGTALGDVTVELTRLRAAPAATPPTHAAPQAAAAKTGSIVVDSRPRGATVFVDGKRLGVTPMRVPDVPAGSHTIRLELAGHKPVTSTLVVASGDPTRFTVTLEQIGTR
jgi:CRISPR/Cas system-associated exonuclease Cas4 (RecB family)